MRTVAIIQARMSSSRLPGKVLMTLDHRPTLEWVVRAARAIPGLDEAVVATSEDASDEAIVQWCAENGVTCHRGPLDDVLGRYLVAARAEQADVVMRLTADCPLLDPHVCGDVLALFRRENLAYASNVSPPTWPDGLSCEVMTREALETAGREAMRTYEREHVTPFIRDNRYRFPQMGLPAPLAGVSEERWTLDHDRDLLLLREIVRRLPDTSRPPAWTEVLAIVDAEPTLREINAGIVRNAAIAKSIQVETPPNRGSARSEALLATGGAALGATRAPVVLNHGYGSRVWDVDGTPYVDLDCGGGTVILGHQDKDVDAALRAQIGNGVQLGATSALELELAAELRALYPQAGSVRFLPTLDLAFPVVPLWQDPPADEPFILGPSLGNGLTIVALVGRTAETGRAEHCDALALAAALAVIRKIRSEPVIERLRHQMTRLREGIEAAIRAHGLDERVRMKGLDLLMDPMLRPRFEELMRHNGVYVRRRVSLSYAHSEGDLTVALGAFERTFAAL